ncbi:sugar nucleotide-binding protein [Acidipropionibacterium jensenii]|uniref:sugar nucleotide-binding protein n=4 Tax=Acidipropionibacterium jensenii TaxID=1749 RepID=UPI000424311D|nr:bifunctional dTDP-4-dehydrorhamnose 3,5-epimerase family protein/NAD(P)-dependent oxidoreductase [Acidipropionibacterium jensenii]
MTVDPATLSIEKTAIPGLLVVHLPMHPDNRGWFKENWQRAKMTALGLPDFAPVQNNMSFNATAGATRGLHAEPWDKLVSVACGKIFGAWVDLRAGASFGRVVTVEMGPETAVYVPRGVGNGYQALVDGTTYTYLVNEHWSAAAKSSYTFANLADPQIGIDWPIPLERAELSEADRHHPALADVTPFPSSRTVVLGANGQLGTSLRKLLGADNADDAASRKRPGRVEFLSREEIDLARPETIDAYDWDGVDTLINAAAYTAVDAAEAADNRPTAWAVNVTAVRHLVEIARRHRITLVHISSDYVFDGTREVHTEEEPFSPLGVYGTTKAAADELVATWARHYILRTSWVVGHGHNFVATMAGLARRGVSPTVVDDQFGRLTFSDDIAAAIGHLLAVDAPYGSYNISSDGPTRSWYDIARRIFEILGAKGTVSPVSTQEYFAQHSASQAKASQASAGTSSATPIAPRPTHSTLDLGRIRSTGFTPADGDAQLRRYLATDVPPH